MKKIIILFFVLTTISFGQIDGKIKYTLFEHYFTLKPEIEDTTFSKLIKVFFTIIEEEEEPWQKYSGYCLLSLLHKDHNGWPMRLSSLRKDDFFNELYPNLNQLYENSEGWGKDFFAYTLIAPAIYEGKYRKVVDLLKNIQNFRDDALLIADAMVGSKYNGKFNVREAPEKNKSILKEYLKKQ